MDKALLIQNISRLLLDNKRQDCIDFANEKYPFIEKTPQKRQYSKYQMCRVFLNDGFIDRYSGDKLIFPGLIKILTIEFPDIFKYHRNWKMSETHLIYWELFPTIDHLIPIARGGHDNENNWITTSMVHNSAKSNWTIEEIGWNLHDKGQLDNWDGLIHYFIDLTNKKPDYEKDNYIKDWKIGLLKAINEIRDK
jgi:hypothetical protein